MTFLQFPFPFQFIHEATEYVPSLPPAQKRRPQNKKGPIHCHGKAQTNLKIGQGIDYILSCPNCTSYSRKKILSQTQVFPPLRKLSNFSRAIRIIDPCKNSIFVTKQLHIVTREITCSFKTKYSFSVSLSSWMTILFLDTESHNSDVVLHTLYNVFCIITTMI